MKDNQSKDDNFVAASLWAIVQCRLWAVRSLTKSNLRGQNAALDEKFETMQAAGEYRPKT
jgi:hypothetical protein